MLSIIAIPLYATSILLILLGFRRVYLAIRPTESYNGLPRPPLVPDLIPFIGHAIGMTKGESFWIKLRDKYGPVFRVRAMGQVRTFVTTPALIAHIYKHSKTFDFYWFRKQMQSVIFGMNYNHAFSDAIDQKVFAYHHRAMQPGAISGLIRHYVDSLESIIEQTRKKVSSGGEVDFADFVFDVIYEASAKAFFGPSFHATAIKAPFLQFDAAFPILNLETLPALARRSAVKSKEVILTLLTDWYRGCTLEDRKLFAPSLAGMFDVWEGEGWSERDLISFFLAEFWALEANAPYAGIWTTVLICRHPQILARIREEISTAIAQQSPPDLHTLLHRPQPELPALLPLTNAAFQETLRCYTDTLSLRIVQEDCILPAHLCAGGVGEKSGLAVRAGEQVICVTRVPAVDPEGGWGEDALVWDPDRWLLSETGKEGRTRGTMSPFGGGVSMCEGRHFASAEILTFITAFIWNFDCEILSDRLRPNLTRPGLGVMQCTGSMSARLSARPV